MAHVFENYDHSPIRLASTFCVNFYIFLRFTIPSFQLDRSWPFSIYFYLFY